MQAGGLRFDPAYLHQFGEFEIFCSCATGMVSAANKKISTSSEFNKKGSEEQEEPTNHKAQKAQRELKREWDYESDAASLKIKSRACQIMTERLPNACENGLVAQVVRAHD